MDFDEAAVRRAVLLNHAVELKYVCLVWGQIKAYLHTVFERAARVEEFLL